MGFDEQLRRPAVAGQFYPEGTDELRMLVDRLLAEAGAFDGEPPKAVIAPHAGFIFSGAVAASAYARLAPARGRIERVVILGPSHFVPVRGVTASSAGRFATPLGEMAVDTGALDTALGQPGVDVVDRAHGREHSLPNGLTLTDSYHCSRYNVNTGRMTPAMLRDVLTRLSGLLDAA